jgi:hypothetical protein
VLVLVLVFGRVFRRTLLILYIHIHTHTPSQIPIHTHTLHPPLPPHTQTWRRPARPPPSPPDSAAAPRTRGSAAGGPGLGSRRTATAGSPPRGGTCLVGGGMCVCVWVCVCSCAGVMVMCAATQHRQSAAIPSTPLSPSSFPLCQPPPPPPTPHPRTRLRHQLDHPSHDKAPRARVVVRAVGQLPQAVHQRPLPDGL